MGGSRAQVNKAHKTRFSSKSTRNIHKTLKDKSSIAKSSVAKGGRDARLQRDKMLREQKRALLLKEKRASTGLARPPSVIVLFGLSGSVDLDSLAKDLLGLLSDQGSGPASSTVASSEYKMRITVLKAPHGDLLSCMEMAKVADLMAFVASARSSCEESASPYIDSFGSQCLSIFKSIGLPSMVVFIRDLSTELKRKNESRMMCFSSIKSEFPGSCKYYPVDTKDELHKFMWQFKEQRSIVPRWREQRPFLMAHQVDMVANDCTPGLCTLLLTGYVRARSLSVNQLVHISGAADFQLSKIDILKDPFSLNTRKVMDAMQSDEVTGSEIICSLDPEPLKQEPLIFENVPDPLAGEQTWPTEAEMAEASRNQKQKKLNKGSLPPGTSEYQAAWIVDDGDLYGGKDDDDDDNGMVVDESEHSFPGQVHTNNFDLDADQGSLHLGDSDEETEYESLIMEGENVTCEQIEDEIQKLKAAHAEDKEFPDEVDTPLDIPARKRFAKYRFLKSQTSTWDAKESLPLEYSRIFAFANFARTQKNVFGKALEMDEGTSNYCVPASSYVRLHVKEVPVSVASKLCMMAGRAPIVACGLLEHESKMSVSHFSIKKHDAYSDPIRSKEELIFHVGFRQFLVRPIFSTNNLNSDKHKMERFLPAREFCIASIYAPISFAPQPLIAMKVMEGGGSIVAAVGALRSIDPDRITLKKIILSGYPQRVSKRKASVRYMFHNPEDVKWFKPAEVWTKCGRRGRIKEPIGTHGAMKCLFNGVVQQHDTVCMSLYKRVFPKWPEHRYPNMEA